MVAAQGLKNRAIGYIKPVYAFHPLVFKTDLLLIIFGSFNEQYPLTKQSSRACIAAQPHS